MRVEVEAIDEAEESFSVVATIEGDKGQLRLRHAFPKKHGNLEEDDNGVPVFVKKLKDIYEHRMDASIESEGVEGKTTSDYEGDYSV